MLKLKNKRVVNLLSFFLLVLVVVANSFFTIKQFKVIEEFNKIQMHFQLFTDSFVIVFLILIQMIACITVVVIETLFVTFVTNFITKKKLKFSNFFSLIIFANITSILLNMTIFSIAGLDNLQDIQWMGWSPGSQMFLTGFIYLYLSNLDSSISNGLKIKLSIIIFSITYGLTFIFQMLTTFV
ncbi:hypothetical protein BK704_07135 [[Bacillus thuringiensis] serovar konkukian]|uniref:hypothetical protein n=1 Tax=Bacillus toyonensis TaxID=155322 RepID=UPI000B42D529|nr:MULTISPECIES: hypothetical protein [Bacillus cereus group]MED1300570.1 hypothetical protein [Bacillus pacificus]MED3087668.1 hypothetical protein [Bacillus toyonensis]OUB15271.1 hypothetical protein BK704_07135 [[Bacillus thuringiensis] serovar konkukian]